MGVHIIDLEGTYREAGSDRVIQSAAQNKRSRVLVGIQLWPDALPTQQCFRKWREAFTAQPELRTKGDRMSVAEVAVVAVCVHRESNPMVQVIGKLPCPALIEILHRAAADNGLTHYG